MWLPVKVKMVRSRNRGLLDEVQVGVWDDISALLVIATGMESGEGMHPARRFHLWRAGLTVHGCTRKIYPLSFTQDIVDRAKILSLPYYQNLYKGAYYHPKTYSLLQWPHLRAISSRFCHSDSWVWNPQSTHLRRDAYILQAGQRCMP